MPSDRPHLLCLGGSMRPVSYSLAACRAAAEAGESAGFSTEVIDPRALHLPTYVPDVDVDWFQPHHEGIVRLVDAYRRADAMVWVSPTYHGTVSGVFKNMLDFCELLSRDSRPYFQGRAVGLVSINDSTTFAAMRDCARELRAWLAPTQIELTAEDFDAEMNMLEGRSKSRITRLVGELAEFVAATRPSREI